MSISEVKGQMTFTELLSDKSDTYKTCRRCFGDYCSVNKAHIEEIMFCPCGEYEERLSCDGCKHKGTGLKYCLFGKSCKRFAVNYDTRTKSLPDKWEAK